LTKVCHVDQAQDQDREYIVDIPDYDRRSRIADLLLAPGVWFGRRHANNIPPTMGRTSTQNYAYFENLREATAANQPAIFVAPQGIGDFPWDYNRDVSFRRPAPRHREPVHRREPGLYHGLQLER
jgi:hypothetical protein